MIGALAIAACYIAAVVAFWPWGVLLVAAHAGVMLLGMWRR